MALVVDPVCEMEFSECDAAAWSVYQNRTYYFCHPVCKKIFDADPMQFVDDENPKVLKPKFTRADFPPADKELFVSAISLSIPARSTKRDVKLLVIPVVAGILAALAMLGIYLGILSAFQSPTHAFEQLATDRVGVGLVALGFGTQIGLYTYLRVIIHAAKAAGATAMTGAGTGTSTLGMLACCAHHLTDIAPLVGLTGASGLSGAIGFFTEWKYAFIGLGLAMNAIGIVVTWRTIRKSKAHLDAMATTAAETAPACH